jgi:hypothetical protein
MPRNADDALRARSKQLFGDRYMLEVCIAVGRAPGRVNLTQLAAEKSVSKSVYSGPLQKLAECGLLLPAASEPEDDRRVRWYTRAESALWQTATELAE